MYLSVEANSVMMWRREGLARRNTEIEIKRLTVGNS